jgi:hypothetical protein
MVEATGLSHKVVLLEGVLLYVPPTLVEIVTHSHVDQLSAFSEIVFAPVEIVPRLQSIYRQFNLRKRIIPWSKYRRTVHRYRGTEVFSSVMEFGFPVIGESLEQRRLMEEYKSFVNGVVVRTPAMDTDEIPLTAEELPKHWLFADNKRKRPSPKTLFKASTTLYDMSVDERIWRAVHQYLHSEPSLRHLSLEEVKA